MGLGSKEILSKSPQNESFDLQAIKNLGVEMGAQTLQLQSALDGQHFLLSIQLIHKMVHSIIHL